MIRCRPTLLTLRFAVVKRNGENCWAALLITHGPHLAVNATPR